MTHVLDALGRIKEYWGAVALADLDDYAQGRIIIGGAVDWNVLNHPGATANHLQTTGAASLGWSPNIVMADGATIGQAAGPLLTFDDTGNDLEIIGCDVFIDPTGALAAPDGTLHVHTASAGAVAAAAVGDDLIVENSTHGGISILTPDANYSLIYFGSPTSNNGAFVQYSHAAGPLMRIGTNIANGELAFETAVAVEAVRIDANGYVGVNGVTVPATALDIGAGAMTLLEMGAPGAGAVNTCRLYVVDNGGKTELYAVFNTGAAQLIAVQP